MGAEHVQKRIDLLIAWCRWHKHVYYECGGGQALLTDDEYDSYYRNVEATHVGPGCSCVESGAPKRPEMACYKEEASAFDILIYDVLEQHRRDQNKKERNEK